MLFLFFGGALQFYLLGGTPKKNSFVPTLNYSFFWNSSKPFCGNII